MAVFQVDKRGLDRAQLILNHMPRELEIANKRATSRALTAARTQAIKGVRETYDAKSAGLRAAIDLNVDDGTMIARGSPTRLMKFKVTPTSPKRATVKASVKRSGGSIGYAFVARMPNGTVGVFSRVGKKRNPITQLHSVSTAQMIGEPTVIENVVDRAREVYEDRLMHEVDRLINRY